MTTSVPEAVSTIMHVRFPDRLGEAAYRQVLELMSELSPVGAGAAADRGSGGAERGRCATTAPVPASSGRS